MTDITLVTVNWNQRPCVELLLKSYVRYHYRGEPLKLLLIDNGSTDDSKEWLIKNEIPFVDLHNNLGHENALNYVYNDIKTKYVLLNDTDVEYTELCDLGEGIYDYVWRMEVEGCDSCGELIDHNYINDIKIKDRISPWIWIFNIKKMHESGVKYFRDPKCENWTYDVGSWQWEKMKEIGINNLKMVRFKGNQDEDLISMRYDRLNHIGKVSWDLSKHGDREGEVMKRRAYINDRLKLYQDIDLQNKFTV